MKFTGEHTLSGSPEQVWAALLDPEVLVRTIPGCERLVATGEHAYDITVTAGVAAVRGTYDGTCRLSDLEPHDSLQMHLRGAGSPGTVDARVRVGFARAEDGGGTVVSYDADAVVGGMVGGVGQRMLTSVSRRMAGEFFGGVDQALGGRLPDGSGQQAGGETPAAAATRSGEPPVGQVYTAPPRAGALAVGSTEDFLKGLAVGAGLVVLGVLLGRRR